MQLSFLGGFLLKAIAWLLVCLLVWYPASSYLAVIPSLLSGWVVDWVFPVWAEGIERTGSVVNLLTRLEMPGIARADAGQIAMLTPYADYRVYGYGLPLLAALLLASGAAQPIRKVLLGAVILLPFQVWGLCFDWLKQVALVAGAQTYWSSSLGGLAREAIALGYQFGVLVLPTLVPVIIWAALDRRFLSTFLLEASLSGLEGADQGANHAGGRGEKKVQ